VALVTISEAANLTGKARKTLYAHIKSGKVSSRLGKDNVRKIDTSELARVYELKVTGNSKVTPNVTPQVTSGNTQGNSITLTPEQLKDIIKTAVSEAMKEVVPVLLEHKQETNIRTTSSGTPKEKTNPSAPSSYLDLNNMSFVKRK